MGELVRPGWHRLVREELMVGIPGTGALSGNGRAFPQWCTSTADQQLLNADREERARREQKALQIVVKKSTF